MSFEFEWDPKKAKANLKNHDGVSFEEGMTVFADPLAKIFRDVTNGARLSLDIQQDSG